MNATRTGPVAGALHTPPRRPTELFSAIVWNHRLGRDFVTWTALALVVAAILVVTTRHGVSTQGQTRTGANTEPRGTQTREQPGRHVRSPKTAELTKGGQIHRASNSATESNHSTSTTTSTSSTSTSTSTSTTIATAPLTSIDVPGTLTYPDDVATTYPLDVGTGIVRATLVFRKDVAFTLSLRCNRTARSRSSTKGTIAIAKTVTAGRCEFEVGLDSLSGGADPYHLQLRYPSVVTGKTP